jgi:hypothetical protein
MQKGKQKGFLRNVLELNKHVHLLLLLLSYRYLLLKAEGVPAKLNKR